jgi:magnesium transporter
MANPVGTRLCLMSWSVLFVDIYAAWLERYHQILVGQKISAWGAILIVPTLIAGIFGMNFPREHWWTRSHYGFEVLIVLMVAVSVLLYLRFKRSGWL